MEAIFWYVAGVLIVLMLTALQTAVDVWMFSVGEPHRRRKIVALSARWAFVSGVMVYAFLIDSFRVQYQEPAIWAFLIGGVVVTVLLRLFIK